MKKQNTVILTKKVKISSFVVYRRKLCSFGTTWGQVNDDRICGGVFFFPLYAALLYTLIALVLILCVISSYVFLKPLIFSPIKSENQLTCITLVFETIKCLTPLTIICTIIISISRAKFPLSSDGLLSAGVGSRLPLLWCPIETFRQLLFSHFPKAQRNVPPSFMGNFESASLPIEEVPNFTFGRPSSSEMPPKHSGGVLPSCQL